MTTLLISAHSLPTRLKAGAKDSLFLARSPEALYLGLKKKWLVPFLLLLSLLLVPAVLLPATGFILEKLYPPIGKQFVGLIDLSRVDERLAIRKTQAAFLFWTLSGITVAAGLVGYAPVVRISGEDEKERLLKSQGLSARGKTSLDDQSARYRIDAEIGTGAMGVVFSAFDQKLERQVALKELPSVFVRNTERRERFRREALALAKLSHPGIVQIYDLFDDGDRMVLVMEFVSGGTLEEMITTQAPVSVSEACRLIDSICETLDHVHRAGIVHRDLKPANILVDEQLRLKVTDFGLARLMQESGLTLDGSLMGSPNYMSPEQAAGKPSDQRADFYALGVIFYELLAGTPPFVGEPGAVLVKKLTEPPAALQSKVPGLDDEVAELVMAMLNKNPDERLSDVQDIRARLQAIQSSV